MIMKPKCETFTSHSGIVSLMTIDTLVDSAMGLLALRPAATMDEIAESAGIGRATLFRRFASRDLLVRELSRQAVSSYVDVVAGSTLREDRPSIALRRLAWALAELAPRYGLLALQPLSERVESEILLAADAADEEIKDLIRRGQSGGEFRVDLPAEWIAQSLTWLIVGAADGLRLKTVAEADVPRLVSESILAIAARGES